MAHLLSKNLENDNLKEKNMNQKIFKNARLTQKGDTEANWNKAVGFVPLAKEIIIYQPDENHATSRMKIGDGVTTVQNLPFFGTDAPRVWNFTIENGKLVCIVPYLDIGEKRPYKIIVKYYNYECDPETGGREEVTSCHTSCDFILDCGITELQISNKIFPFIKEKLYGTGDRIFYPNATLSLRGYCGYFKEEFKDNPGDAPVEDLEYRFELTVETNDSSISFNLECFTVQLVEVR